MATAFAPFRKLRMAAEKSPTEVHNPYLAARREWDERYGDLITRARNWRTMAFICGLIALVSSGGLIWQSSKSHVVPFVVVTDTLGRAVASGIADQASPADERAKRAAIIGWVEQLRLVTTDGVAQRKAIDRVYSHIANGSQAQTFISEFYRGAQPFNRASSETVSVEVKSVLATSDRTFEVDWVETTRDLYGAVKSTDHWKGAFTLAVNPPTEERLARINPLGIFITSANWAKVL